MEKFLSAVLINFIKLYKATLSPFFGNSCRYQPSCSQYGTEAIQKHGIMKGCRLTVKRICSCHPWGGYGYDPVPSAPGLKGEGK